MPSISTRHAATRPYRSSFVTTNSKRVVTLMAISTAAALLGAGTAYAYWTSTGTGTSSAASASSSPLSTTTATASTTSLLYPGGTADVTIVFSNPNPFAVKVTSVSGAGTVTSTKTGCSTTGVTLTGATGLTVVVPARTTSDGSASTTLTGAAKMDNTSDSNCQGATFSIPVTFSATSN